jgi:hypothetical protein
VIDEISKGKLTTEYRYHHGYWDGIEIPRYRFRRDTTRAAAAGVRFDHAR